MNNRPINAGMMLFPGLAFLLGSSLCINVCMYVCMYALYECVCTWSFLYIVLVCTYIQEYVFTYPVFSTVLIEWNLHELRVFITYFFLKRFLVIIILNKPELFSYSSVNHPYEPDIPYFYRSPLVKRLLFVKRIITNIILLDITFLFVVFGEVSEDGVLFL
jgi:hypothetical protein